MTYPNILHVERDAICGNALVVRRFEEVIRIALLREAFPQALHFGLELLGNQDLVRQGGKRQVKVVREFAFL